MLKLLDVFYSGCTRIKFQNRKCSLLFLALVSMVYTISCQASTPFLAHAQNPIVGIYQLVRSGEFNPAPPENWQFRYQFELINYAVAESFAQEKLVMTGETYRFTTSLSRSFSFGANQPVVVELAIPIMTHRDPLLNQFIYEWHDLFGFSQNTRKTNDGDQLEIFYRDNDVLQLQNTATSIADLMFNVAMPIHSSFVSEPWFPKSQLRLGLQLPTGDLQHLSGSESVGVSFGVDMESLIFRSSNKWQDYAALNFIYPGSSNGPLPRTRSFVTYSMYGLEFNWRPSLVFKLQMEGYSSVFESQLKALGADSFRITTGAVLTSGKMKWEFAIVENLFTDTTPDFTFYLSLQRFIQ